MSHNSEVAIIGAGLAGCEAALVLARAGIRVKIFEARPIWRSPAHKTDLPAELVCSNSFKSIKLPSSHALLKEELRLLQSPLLDIAQQTSIPAGSALAVDREAFSSTVNQRLSADKLVSVVHEEICSPPLKQPFCIIAAGPLASPNLVQWLTSSFLTSSLHFYDAIAPIVSADSIDYNIVFFASRWEEGTGDYLNCPFDEQEYRLFYEELKKADQVNARSFENQKFFEACLPVEVAAQRGYKALAFGPLRPVGIINPHTGKRPFAVCQLRKENINSDSFNLVGFQTRLTFPEQKRVFRLIPGLNNAQFLRFGSIHRNTYMQSPQLLTSDLSFKDLPNLFLAGQICGNEGYTESIATGHYAALSIASRIKGKKMLLPPPETAIGALINHITVSDNDKFTPTNIHFGLFPPLENTGKRKIGKAEKKKLICSRAIESLKKWKTEL